MAPTPRALLAAGLAAAASAAGAAAAGCGRTIIGADFSEYSGGYQKVSTAGMDKIFPQGPDVRTSEGTVKPTGLVFVKDGSQGELGGGHLKSILPQGCAGTYGCGTTFDVRFPAVDEATLEYDVKFEPGYDFHLGGKLPGLCSEDCPSGCLSSMKGRGWSARVMWRNAGNLMSYSYVADQKDNCGDNWPYPTSAQSGEWMKVTMYIKLNSAGQKNGVQTVWLNGRQVFHSSSVKFRMEDKHSIELFTFRNFHGGSGAKWGSPRTQYQLFDNISVKAGRCAPSGGGPSLPTQAAPNTVDDDSPPGSQNAKAASSPSAKKFLRRKFTPKQSSGGSPKKSSGGSPKKTSGGGSKKSSGGSKKKPGRSRMSRPARKPRVRRTRGL